MTYQEVASTTSYRTTIVMGYSQIASSSTSEGFGHLLSTLSSLGVQTHLGLIDSTCSSIQMAFDLIGTYGVEGTTSLPNSKVQASPRAVPKAIQTANQVQGGENALQMDTSYSLPEVFMEVVVQPSPDSRSYFQMQYALAHSSMAQLPTSKVAV